jgi:hypothetical protein
MSLRSKEHEWKTFKMATTLIIASAVLYCSWPLGFWLNPRASQTGLASELGAFGQPYNWIFIWGDIISGALLVTGVFLIMRLYKLTPWAQRALIFLAVYGVCGALDAAVPMNCLSSEQVCGPVLSDPLLILHGVFDIAGSLALVVTLVASAVFVRRYRHDWLTWVYAIGIGGTLFALLSGTFYVWGGPGYWAQRYYITLSCIWVASMPFILHPKHAKLSMLTNKDMQSAARELAL